ncbi:MAG TPA: 16S rRNA (guanine(966)-N(2))-methyltransferase RsmD [Hyphomicrobiaceae bacterium]|jgi:16S rRNA (guanine966-N2)-methyltransferase
MRIVAGRFGGRTLAAPGGARTRPTSDRVREAMFNILGHGIDGFAMSGVRVLDLFAGTGALGLEALSRGASFCLFVEEDAAARGLIRRNIEALGLTGVTKVFRRNATDLGPAGHRGGFGLAFIDPPYEQGLGPRALGCAAAGGWLAPGAVAVVEESRRAGVTLPPGFAPLEQRTWGDTQVLVARFLGPA